MARVIAAYVVNEEALAAFLKSVDYEPDAPNGTPDIIDICFAWSNWWTDQQIEACLFRPNCFQEGGKTFLAILSRSSRDRAIEDIALTEMDYDREMRDKFLASTGNKLDASDLRFVAKPQDAFLRAFGIRTAQRT